MSVKGRVVWHDLMTSDVEGAGRFYSAVFGWELRSGGGFALLYQGDEHVGAVMTLPPGEGPPPMWLSYFGTDSADESAAAITASGGRIVVPASDVPGGGRMVIAADPGGAAFAAFQYTGARTPKPESAPDEQAPTGTFCWDELYARDTAAAAAFYGSVFGFSTTPMDMGPMGTYTLFLRDGRNAAGMMALMPDVPHPFWLPYVAVDDADATCARVAAAGGEVKMAPDNVPNVGRFAVFTDPQGAALGILGPAA